MLSGEWQVYEKHWTWDTCYICVVFKGRCFTVESTFKNIRPVSWSQQDTSPCLICDFMQHFIYCLLHFMLLFIYVFSFFSLVLLSSSLGFDASIRKNLENRKNHAKIFSYEKETAFLWWNLVNLGYFSKKSNTKISCRMWMDFMFCALIIVIFFQNV